MADHTQTPPPEDDETPRSPDDRRDADRRKEQKPFDGPDRRDGDRRSGQDRRAD